MPESGTMRRLPLRGVGGLVFTVGMVALAVIYVPVLGWFLAIAVPIGVIIALGLHFWHKHSPVPEPENKKKVFHLDDR
jgi:hypothetical protein